MMDEARKDPESVIVQDPRFSQLDWSPNKKTKWIQQEKPKALAMYWPKWYCHRSCSSWRGEATLCFIRENTVKFTAWIVSDVLQPCRFDSRRSSCSSRCLMKTVKPTWCLPSVRQVCDGWDADESGWRDERYSEQGVPPE